MALEISPISLRSAVCTSVFSSMFKIENVRIEYETCFMKSMCCSAKLPCFQNEFRGWESVKLAVLLAYVLQYFCIFNIYTDGSICVTVVKKWDHSQKLSIRQEWKEREKGKDTEYPFAIVWVLYDQAKGEFWPLQNSLDWSF